jgi:hypothetical protein
MAGREPMKPMLLFNNWSGHSLQTMPWTEADGYPRLIPLVDAA